MDQITPAIIATWPRPNYDNPVTRQSATDAVIYSTTILMLLFIGARFYVRANSKTGLGREDWFMLFSAFLAVAVSVIMLVGTSHVVGRHIYDVKPAWIMNFAKLNLSLLTVSNSCITFAKISVCLTYLRLFPSNTNMIFSWTMITYVVLWNIIISTLYIVQCSPIESFWDFTITKKKCLDARALITISMALNALSDVIVFLWPIMPLWGMRLPLRKRMHLISVFAFGVLTSLAGILKTVYAQSYFTEWDITWHADKIIIMFAIEYNVGIMSGCLPCLRPFLAMVLPQYFHSSSSAEHQTQKRSEGSSWRLASMSSKRAAPNRLDSNEPQGCAKDFENTSVNNLNAARTWTTSERGALDREVEVMPDNGIRIMKNTTIHENRCPAGTKVAGDASSEEWIMKNSHEIV